MPSPYIKAMHPKSEISPELSSIERILKAGWVGQLKIHGHRVQIHIPADTSKDMIAYNRQGQRHAKELTEPMAKELHRLFRPKKAWTVLDAEWLKRDDKIYVFDILQLEGEVLRKRTFLERFALLPRAFISPRVTVLPLIKDTAACMKAMQSEDETIEGLVFKSSTSVGFSDTSIVRCRKRK